jgi:hypothetical protein
MSGGHCRFVAGRPLSIPHKEQQLKVPKTTSELEHMIKSIESSSDADGLEPLSKKFDLMLHLLLEIRNNLRGY